MECSCQIECGEGEPIEHYQADRLELGFERTCIECGDAIPAGATSEYVTGFFEGDPVAWHTCEVCLRVRDDLMGRCYCHGTMREDIGYCLGVDYVSGEFLDDWEGAA